MIRPRGIATHFPSNLCKHGFMNSTAIPGMSYRDAAAAIEWLCRVFGFEKYVVVPGEDGTIVHAELKLGGGMIMLGSINPKTSQYLKQPDEVHGFETRGINLVVEDADAVYARVKEAGGEIVAEMEHQPHGRSFVCRDLERRIWWVGTYDPWRK